MLGVAYGGWMPSKGGGCGRINCEVQASERDGKKAEQAGNAVRVNLAVAGRYQHGWNVVDMDWVRTNF